METPTPVDLNKLKSILGNAKKIMKASDEKFSTVKNTNKMSESYDMGNSYTETPIYDERDEKEPNYGIDYSEYTTSAPIQERGYTKEDVINSKLPPIIKEAMLKNPIPKLTGPPSKFTLDDMSDLVEPKTRPQKQIIRENKTGVLNGTITITVDELNELIDKRVNETIAKLFVKTLTEQTIKKTVSTLMSEGKLTTKKKIG